MSRVYTSNPGTRPTRASRGTGRGAQHSLSRASSRVPPRAHAMENNHENPEQGAEGASGQAQSSTGAENRIQHRGAYSVIAPDEKKRASVARKAQSETEAYEKYKQEKKLGYVSYHGVVGGGTPQTIAGPQGMPQNRNVRPIAKKTLQEWKQEAKQAESAKDEQYKAAQRRKAFQNSERDSARHRRLEEDRKKANEALLSRIEHENRLKNFHK